LTTVLICTGHVPTRDLLRRAVAGVPGVVRVDCAATGEQVLAHWPPHRADLLLLDVSLPGIGGVETVYRLMRRDPLARVVMLAGPADRDAVARAVAAGASGYLAKDVTREELCAAVLAALAGPRPRGVPAMRAAGEPKAPELTERERQVLQGMAQGKSNGQIGRTLYLSEDTVKTHARRLFRKMGVNDRAQAVALGFRWGLVR
jgi:DNA-binding NarL/FixJ family response regulator